MKPCNFYTIKNINNNYLHKGLIKASPLFFWTTKQNNVVCHAPQENIIGIKTYIGDETLTIIPCPCIGGGELPISITNTLPDMALSGLASRKAEELF